MSCDGLPDVEIPGECQDGDIENDDLIGYIKQKTVRFGTPSYVPSNPPSTGQGCKVGFSCDSYGNMRPLSVGRSCGAGRGMYYSPFPSGGPIDCQPGEIRVRNYLAADGTHVGYICSTLDIGTCPEIGGFSAKCARMVNPNAAVDLDDAVVECRYDVWASSQPSSYDDYTREFITSVDSELAEVNTNFLNSQIMPNYCSGISTHCPVDAYTLLPMNECSRFVAYGDQCDPENCDCDANRAGDDGAIACQRWARSSDESNHDVADGIMNAYCTARSDPIAKTGPPECSCINRTYEPLYNEIGSPIPAGCWWRSCASVATQLTPSTTWCEVDSVQICNQTIIIDDNFGGIDPTWEGDCNLNEGGGGGGGGLVGLEEVVWNDLSTWPVWIWVMIGIGILISILLIYMVVRKMTKPSTAEQLADVLTKRDELKDLQQPQPQYYSPS